MRSRTSAAITEAILDEVGDVIVNYSTGAIGVPIEKRIAYLRELRPDVAALNMSSMNYAKYSKRRKDFVFKAVFENSFDTIIEFLTTMRELGHQARARVLRRRPRRQPRPADRHGPGHRATPDLAGDGGQRRHPPERRQRRRDGRPDPGRARGRRQLAGDRDLAPAVDAALGGADARRQRPRRPRGQPLPAERRDGRLQRRADRQGPADGRGRRPPRRHRCRGAPDAWAVPKSEPTSRDEPSAPERAARRASAPAPSRA